MTSLLDGSTAAWMLQHTGGVAVVDTAASETTYGHFERVPFDFEGDGRVITTEPSVVIPASVFTNIGPKAGIGRSITVDGDAWVVAGIVPADDDGGTIRLMLGGT